MAAAPEYRAGVAAAGEAKAVVLEDRRGTRAVIAEAGFAVTRQVSDVASAQLIKLLSIDRAAILIRGGRGGQARVEDLVTAALAAAGQMDPAEVMFDSARVSITAPQGRCVAVLFPLEFEGCSAGVTVRSPLRAAFQMVELTAGLLQRGQVTPSYALQAIALGKQVTILGLGGDVPAAEFRAAGRLVVPFANDNSAWPADGRVRTAVERLLDRLR